MALVEEQYEDVTIVGNKKHWWVYCDGWYIDLTMRQFDKTAPLVIMVPKEKYDPDLWPHWEITVAEAVYLDGNHAILFDYGGIVQ